jgi:hypothetical protein
MMYGVCVAAGVLAGAAHAVSSVSMRMVINEVIIKVCFFIMSFLWTVSFLWWCNSNALLSGF